MLDFFHPGKIYVFCSDDYRARVRIAGVKSVFCMSILAAFYILKEYSVSKDDVEPYFEALIQFLNGRNQDSFKVWKWNNERTQSRTKVACRQVFEEIYAGKFELLKNGELRYIR